MKLVILSHTQYSHFSIALQMTNKIKNHVVYFFYDSSFEHKIKKKNENAYYIPYPKSIEQKISSMTNDYTMQFDINTNVVNKERIISDIALSYDFLISIGEVYFVELVNLIEMISPDYILRDACCLFGRMLGDYLNIPIIGYTTSSIISYKESMYSKRDFLEKVYNLSLEYYSDYEIMYIFDQITVKINQISEKHQIRPFSLGFLFDPGEQLNFCFGIVLSSQDNNYVCLKPFIFEDTDTTKVSRQRNAIYVSSGSTVSFPIIVYNYVINIAKQSEDHFFITFKYIDSELVTKSNRIPCNVSIKSFHNQTEILNQSKLFLTHAGYNSMIEAILYEVPMLVMPLCSDQFFDAHYIQKNGLGKIINIETINSSADLLDIINEMEQNTIYVDNIRRLKKHLSHLITFCDFIDRLER